MAFSLFDGSAGATLFDPLSARDSVDPGAGASLPKPLPGGLAELVKHGCLMRKHRVHGIEMSLSLERVHLNFCER